jgi:hypothetical protein
MGAGTWTGLEACLEAHSDTAAVRRSRRSAN